MNSKCYVIKSFVWISNNNLSQDVNISKYWIPSEYWVADFLSKKNTTRIFQGIYKKKLPLESLFGLVFFLGGGVF